MEDPDRLRTETPRADIDAESAAQYTHWREEYAAANLPYVGNGESLTAEQRKQAIALLVENHDWTEKGAEKLIRLAELYGFWFLEHAAAIARAMEIEDGTAGY